ncbi:type VII secretion protein EccB [Amycolatopsis cihanbeyliensis]|uniref:Type VII secretion protein EccB n=1 Tax=Amycolatopsis cihanbeyliensis TaxID=1128664 RepID=A0A542DJ80_AMYCI|nr:type VII secretion protein EccB [Amycolatopsis cihanbeyliensis]TQJ03151.1 type VII secretion protein EccB [Amycolatopsis cihanbeyliensis]
MPSTPTTKSQVQAYQFVLRRMQSALVRRDAVMLHDPMRTHSRATVVGVVISVLGLLGFMIFGLFKPKPTVPNSGNIVIGKESGSIYVVTGNPKTLIPTFNLASARLLLMAQQERAQEGGDGAAAGGGNVEVKEPNFVSDEQLKDIPRARQQGIPDGPPLLPTAEQRISDNWAVCDVIGLNMSLPDPTSANENTTTVVGGVEKLGKELTQNEALLATAENGKTYLIYRLSGDANRPHADTVRAEIDMENQRSVRRALNLSGKPRYISMSLLNAIPPVGEIKAPTVPGAGSPNNFGLDGIEVGQVFSSSRVDSTLYFVVTREGVQQVSKAVADMVRFERSPNSGPPPEVSVDRLQGLSEVGPGMDSYLDVADYPKVVPTVLDPVRYPSSCLGWTIEGEGQNRDGHTKVFVGADSPVPADAQGNSEAVEVGQPGPNGLPLDSFYMQPGYAAVVRSATGKDSFGRGPIQLVSDRGMRYGVPSERTAASLGLNDPRPAPESILRLLPTGPSLNTQDALRTFDSVPVEPPEPGDFEVQSPEAAGAPGGG